MGPTHKKKNTQCLRVIKLAFTKPELDFLMEQEEFRRDLERCSDVSDMENICVKGHKLITKSSKLIKARP